MIQHVPGMQGGQCWAHGRSELSSILPSWTLVLYLPFTWLWRGRQCSQSLLIHPQMAPALFPVQAPTPKYTLRRLCCACWPLAPCIAQKPLPHLKKPGAWQYMGVPHQPSHSCHLAPSNAPSTLTKQHQETAKHHSHMSRVMGEGLGFLFHKLLNLNCKLQNPLWLHWAHLGLPTCMCFNEAHCRSVQGLRAH